jgi:cobalt-zinc-cadmium efflux system outer membrane protein
MHLYRYTWSLLLFAQAAQAEPLTFDAALDRAEANAPSVRAREASVSAARSSAIASDRLPDPTLDVTLRDLPVTGPDAFTLNRDDFTATQIGVTQQFINPAKRHARLGRAQADIGVAEADAAVEARAVRLATALAWIDLYYAQKRLARLSLLENSLRDLQSTVTARLASGSARPSQAFEPDQLRAQIADRKAGVLAEIARARSQLTRYTGDPDPQTTGDPPGLDIDETSLRARMDSLPALRALDARATVADADVRLAEADRRPDWRVGAAYARREPAFGDLVTVAVSIDLPLFGGKRQQPRIAAAGDLALAARLDREAAQREWAAQLDGDLAEHAMHHSRLVNARDNLVPLAKRRGELDLVSYRAGRLDLGTALLSTLALAEAEVDLLDREAEVARDAVRINMTYGEDRP